MAPRFRRCVTAQVIERTVRIHAIQDRLSALRAEYAATHQEAKTALNAKDYDRLTALSLREFQIVGEYCELVKAVMKAVP